MRTTQTSCYSTPAFAVRSLGCFIAKLATCTFSTFQFASAAEQAGLNITG